MANDPAFLFYPGDWQLGTMTMSRHLKGCYMDLLVAQFSSGSLSLEEIRTVLGTDFSAWNTLQKKFAQDATGKFFNERLEVEKTKRKEYSLKQKERVKKRWDKSGNTVVLPKEDENRNENEIGIGNENKGGAGGIVLKVIGSEAVLYPTFSDFWTAYGKDVGRENSEYLWANLLQPEKEKIMEYLREYIPATPDKKFRLNPENFLVNKSWNDEIIKPNGNTGNRHQPITTDWKQVARDGEEFLRKQGLA